MKTLSTPAKVSNRSVRPVPARLTGLCQFALMELTDDCSIQGRRRRSEIAQALSQGKALRVVALAA